MQEKEKKKEVPKLIIVGTGGVVSVALNNILSDIALIEAEYGKDTFIIAEAFDKEIIDTTDRINTEIKKDLQGYIEKNFGLPRNKIFKSNGRSELVLVDNPDYIGNDGNFKKHRKVITNISPKKLKRKKNKKTHR